MNDQIKLSKSLVVAYFCMEFALDDEYGIYSGGLGVLAGDLLHQASDSDANLTGVGLAYSLTYKQKLDKNGRQVEEDVLIDPVKNGLIKVVDDQGQPVEVMLPIHDRQLRIQAWIKKVGKIDLILLDTNISKNLTADRQITNQLYIGDREHRLLQEMVLGIGGVKMLDAIGIKPDIYHMNEGHSAFLSLEIAHRFKQLHRSLNFDAALEQSKQKIVFTNHTLVSAGRDVFSFDLVSTYLFKYAQTIGISVNQIIKMGKIKDTSLFSMDMMALHNAIRTNAVSQYHAQRAKEIWRNYSLIPITNGIYFPRWLSPHKKLLTAPHPSVDAVWQAHQRGKLELIRYVEQTTQKIIPANALIISWARRFVLYKRPLALFWQLDWLEHIIKSSPVPLYFLYGGKVHPGNEEGKDLMSQVVELSKTNRFKNNLTFIPNYSLEVAQYLVRGSDVWLNTPIEGYEACGTSGMKAALNGVLQCSTNDGWVREVDWTNVGWLLDSQHISESLYQTLEREIIPLFAQTKTTNFQPWVKRMIKSSQIIANHYSTERMLSEYYSRLYRTD